MISIKSFGTKKKDGSTSSNTSSGGVGYANATVNTDVNPVKIWGQLHDHKGDVDGDITTSGSISSQGGITTPSNISGANLSLSGSINCDDITCDDINSGGDVHTTDIHCANINCLGDIETNNIEANNGTITNLVAEYLTVTKQAHFFELIIDKIKSNSGQVVLSAANAIIDKVETVTDGYKLYWRREDATTHKKIGNDFAPYDQIRCQTFNVHEGTNFNVDNKYYWRLVTDTGSAIVEIDGEQVECNYIEVSDIDKDGTSIPEVGDEIVQLGNRTDTSRQNAIILSAVTSPDPNVTAPSIVQYKGINSYSLQGKILNQMAANGNTFTGNFMVVNGNTVDNVLNLITGTTPSIQTDTEATFLMVNSSNELDSLNDCQNLPTNIKLTDGTNQINYTSWTSNSYIMNGVQQVPLKPANTYTDTGLYISEISSDNAGGVDVDWNFVQDYAMYTNYSIEIFIEWTDNGNTYHVTKTIPVNVLSQGQSIPGADAEFDRLQIMNGDATVAINDTLNVAFTAQVQHIKGNVITTQTNLNNYQVDVMYSDGQMYTATKDTAHNRFVFTDTVTDFSGEPTIPTSITFSLIYRSGQSYTLVDTLVIPIKFNAGSIFEVKEDAITAAVTSSNGYTDAQIAVVNLTAQGLESRVTAIEGDYVTSSELTQTANEISMSVYDDLKNRTGIDVQAGNITLNADTTTIVGNLNLRQTTNGITVYDSDGTPRIQIQPNEIGSVENYNAGAVNGMLIQYYTSGQNNYDATFAKKKIGQFKATDTIGIRDLYAYLSSWVTRTYNYPSSNTIQLTLSVYKEGNNTALQSYTYTLNRNNPGQYTSNSTLSYTVQSDGVYLIGAAIACGDTVTTSSYVYEEVMFTVSQKIEHQTYIGVDGFVSNPAANCLMWAGSDELQLRWEQDGIRLNNDGLQRLPDMLQQNTLWLPFDNYTAVTHILGPRYTLNGNKYEYTIDPLNDKGLVACSCPSWDESNHTTHVSLPPYSFTYNDTAYTLPAGYTVNIVNTSAIGYGGSWSDRQYVYVEDANNNRTWQVTGAFRMFVHIGAGLWTSNA